MPDMEALQKRLGYSFQNAALLQTALTHPSYAAERRADHYQRLEFLGDAVLELVSSRFLYEQFPQVGEGQLTRMRAARVCEQSLAQAARRIGLSGEIRLSIGERRTGGAEKPSILSDVLEAVIGAMYLDGGLEAAERLIRKEILSQTPPEAVKDAKSSLQEALQQDGRMPSYEAVSVEGPPHAPTFTYRVSVGGDVIGEGRGASKQAAQQAAARDALDHPERLAVQHN